MNISKVSIKRPVTTLMIMLIVILLGVISFTRLSVDLLPTLDIPIAAVSATYSGAGPQEIETLVTRPLEGVLGTVSNVKNIQSMSSNGSSVVIMEFNDNTDMDFATLQMREKIDLIKNMLPDGVDTPTVLKIDPNMMAMMEIGVSGEKDLEQLKEIVEDRIASRIERIEGVASVTVSGGKEREIQITLLPEKMKGYMVTIPQVSQMLAQENMNLPGGEVRQGDSKLLIRTVGEFHSIEEIRNLPLTTSGGVIYLRDIATVEEGFKDQKSYTLINGKPSIKLSIQKQSTANTVTTADLVNAELAKIRSEISDIEIMMISDNSQYIKSSIANVGNTAAVGGILAVVVLFIFLRNIRSTLIVGVAIPISVVATFALMYFNGLTLNLISIGGLSLGVGMLVDNAIVVLENIYRHRENGEDRVSAADQGSSEVGMAVIASTLTTVAVFLPIVFVDGMAAKIFKEMALTVTFSLVASLAVALTVVPMLASKLLKVEKADASKKKRLTTRFLDAWGRGLDKIDMQYRKILQWAITHRKSTVAITLVVFIGTLSLVPAVGMEFFPAFDEGVVSISIRLPKGTVLEETSLIAEEVERRIREVEEIQEVIVSVGGGGGMLSSGSSTDRASFTINVGTVSERERSTDGIIDEIRSILSDIPGAEISVESSGANNMSMGKPISIEIAGDEFDQLESIANDMVRIIESVEGTREVGTSLEEGTPEAQIRLNRTKASAYGINVAVVANTIRTAVQGQVATRYKVDGTEIDVKVMHDPSRIHYLNDIKNIFVTSPTGTLIPLDELAEIEIAKGLVAINRNNQKRTVTITADLVGRDLNSASQELEAKFSAYPFPDGYSYEFGGEQKQMTESFASLGMALILAILMVYMVLAAQFESLLHPFTVMFSVPLALTGAILGLFVTGRTLSMPAFIGIIMLAGIVVNNAIVLVDYINTLRREGYERNEAILRAGPIRLRPILMTTLTTVLALLPMALGLGEGAEAQTPMATSVIGGLTLSTILTLVIIPVIYTLFDDIVNKTKAKKERKQELHA